MQVVQNSNKESKTISIICFENSIINLQSLYTLSQDVLFIFCFFESVKMLELEKVPHICQIRTPSHIL